MACPLISISHLCARVGSGRLFGAADLLAARVYLCRRVRTSRSAGLDAERNFTEAESGAECGVTRTVLCSLVSYSDCMWYLYIIKLHLQ